MGCANSSDGGAAEKQGQQQQQRPRDDVSAADTLRPSDSVSVSLTLRPDQVRRNTNNTNTTVRHSPGRGSPPGPRALDAGSARGTLIYGQGSGLYGPDDTNSLIGGTPMGGSVYDESEMPQYHSLPPGRTGPTPAPSPQQAGLPEHPGMGRPINSTKYQPSGEVESSETHNLHSSSNGSSSLSLNEPTSGHMTIHNSSSGIIQPSKPGTNLAMQIKAQEELDDDPVAYDPMQAWKRDQEENGVRGPMEIDQQEPHADYELPQAIQIKSPINRSHHGSCSSTGGGGGGMVSPNKKNLLRVTTPPKEGGDDQAVLGSPNNSAGIITLLQSPLENSVVLHVGSPLGGGGGGSTHFPMDKSVGGGSSAFGESDAPTITLDPTGVSSDTPHTSTDFNSSGTGNGATPGSSGTESLGAGLAASYPPPARRGRNREGPGGGGGGENRFGRSLVGPMSSLKPAEILGAQHEGMPQQRDASDPQVATGGLTSSPKGGEVNPTTLFAPVGSNTGEADTTMSTSRTDSGLFRRAADSPKGLGFSLSAMPLETKIECTVCCNEEDLVVCDVCHPIYLLCEDCLFAGKFGPHGDKHNFARYEGKTAQSGGGMDVLDPFEKIAGASGMGMDGFLSVSLRDKDTPGSPHGLSMRSTSFQLNAPCRICIREMPDDQDTYKCQDCAGFIVCDTCGKDKKLLQREHNNDHKFLLLPRKHGGDRVKQTFSLQKRTDTDGRKFFNDYVVVKTLGRGATGKVQLIQHVTSHGLYALKSMDKAVLARARKGLSGESALDDAMREIAIMKVIDHPNVVSLIECIDDPTQHKLYLIMELMDASVYRLGLDPPMEPAKLRCVIGQALRGVLYLHSQVIFHRDIKPDNLLMKEENGELHVKLSDFGVSHSKGGTVSGTSGTPLFLCPELVVGQEVSGEMVDAWAFGVTLYSMAFGKLPWPDATSVGAVFDMILNVPVRVPAECEDNRLRDVLEALLKPQLKDRISLRQAARMPFFVEELEEALGATGREHFVGDLDVEPVNSLGAAPAFITCQSAEKDFHSATVQPVSPLTRRVTVNEPSFTRNASNVSRDSGLRGAASGGAGGSNKGGGGGGRERSQSKANLYELDTSKLDNSLVLSPKGIEDTPDQTGLTNLFSPKRRKVELQSGSDSNANGRKGEAKTEFEHQPFEPAVLQYIVTKVLIVRYNCLRSFNVPTKHLEMLRIIRIENNELSEFPLCITSCKNLEHLSLSSNNIPIIPDDIVGMDRLKRLEVDNNCLNALPTACYVLPNLKSISVIGNPIAQMPVWIEQCVDLCIAMDNYPKSQIAWIRKYVQTCKTVTILWNDVFPIQVLPHVFIGREHTSSEQRVLAHLGIKVVIKTVPVMPPGPLAMPRSSALSLRSGRPSVLSDSGVLSDVTNHSSTSHHTPRENEDGPPECGRTMTLPPKDNEEGDADGDDDDRDSDMVSFTISPAASRRVGLGIDLMNQSLAGDNVTSLHSDAGDGGEAGGWSAFGPQMVISNQVEVGGGGGSTTPRMRRSMSMSLGLSGSGSPMGGQSRPSLFCSPADTAPTAGGFPTVGSSPTRAGVGLLSMSLPTPSSNALPPGSIVEVRINIPLDRNQMKLGVQQLCDRLPALVAGDLEPPEPLPPRALTKFTTTSPPSTPAPPPILGDKSGSVENHPFGVPSAETPPTSAESNALSNPSTTNQKQTGGGSSEGTKILLMVDHPTKDKDGILVKALHRYFVKHKGMSSALAKDLVMDAVGGQTSTEPVVDEILDF